MLKKLDLTKFSCRMKQANPAIIRYSFIPVTSAYKGYGITDYKIFVNKKNVIYGIYVFHVNFPAKN